MNIRPVHTQALHRPGTEAAGAASTARTSGSRNNSQSFVANDPYRPARQNTPPPPQSANALTQLRRMSTRLRPQNLDNAERANETTDHNEVSLDPFGRIKGHPPFLAQSAHRAGSASASASVKKHQLEMHLQEVSCEKLAKLAHTNGGVVPKHFKLDYKISNAANRKKIDLTAFSDAYAKTVGEGNKSSPSRPRHVFHGTTGSYPGDWKTLTPKDDHSGFWVAAPGSKFFQLQEGKPVDEVELGEMDGPIEYAGNEGGKRFITVWEPKPEAFSVENVATHDELISSEEKTFEYQGFPIEYAELKAKVTLRNETSVEYLCTHIPKSQRAELGVLGMMESHPKQLAQILDRAKLFNDEGDIKKRVEAIGLDDICELMLPHLMEDDLQKIREAGTEADRQFKKISMPLGTPHSALEENIGHHEQDGVTYSLHGSGAGNGVGNLTMVAVYELPRFGT
jgi:hypothetical protein